MLKSIFNRKPMTFGQTSIFNLKALYIFDEDRLSKLAIPFSTTSLSILLVCRASQEKYRVHAAVSLKV